MTSRPFLFYIILSAVTAGLLPGPYSSAQDNKETDPYREVFGGDYTYAENLVEMNGWWADTLESHGLDPRFAMAIIFPELIRYSSIIDYIQVSALEVLYVQYGRDYADFSIGYFQMKPSFAEHIEADIIRYNIDTFYPEISHLVPDTTDDPNRRAARIGRLKDERCQLLYLEAFIRIMDHQYHEQLTHFPLEMKLEFYATAYNAGYFKDPATIRQEIRTPRFYVGLVPSSKYQYHDISLEYFREGF